jgi:asparagine synthase (glutamine-hydrolysing)
LKAILAHPEIDRVISLEGLDCFLSLNYVPAPWTLVAGIEKLAAGTWLEWENGEVTTGTYWALPFAAPVDYSIAEAKEELHRLLEQSVSEHMLSDVPLGIWLSGGMDSTTILHYASRATTSRLKTFSITYRGRSCDESDMVRLAAREYGTEHTELDLTPEQDLEGAIREFAYYSDEPNADAGSLPVWFLSKLCKATTTVALSGEGADELFAGYLTCRADILAGRARYVPRGLLRTALAAARQLPVSDEKISFEYKVKRFLEGSLLTPGDAHVFWNGTFNGKQKQSLLRTELPGSFRRLLGAMDELPETDDVLAPMLWFDQKYYLADDILVKSDRMSMAHAVEVRPPFLDHRIVEFAATLPPELKIRGTQQKRVLAELRRDKLPAALLHGKKNGFDIPAHEWLRGPLRELMVETLREGTDTYGDLFDAAAVEALMQRHLRRELNLGYHLWGLLILFLWMKRWKMQSTTKGTGESLSLAIAGA